MHWNSASTPVGVYQVKFWQIIMFMRKIMILKKRLNGKLQIVEWLKELNLKKLSDTL